MVEFCWINSSPYGMDTIHNLDWGKAAWELCNQVNWVWPTSYGLFTQQREQGNGFRVFVRWGHKMTLWEGNADC